MGYVTFNGITYGDDQTAYARPCNVPISRQSEAKRLSRWKDHIVDFAMILFIFTFVGLAYTICCPSDKLRHDAARFESVPSFAKISLRAK
jgi:hypothetical protein